jgi:type IV pilus assembly protein PilC
LNNIKNFLSVFTNLIRAGEASGNLESVFSELSVSLAKQKDLQQRIKSALIYPIILVWLLLLSLFCLLLMLFQNG